MEGSGEECALGIAGRESLTEEMILKQRLNVGYQLDPVCSDVLALKTKSPTSRESP